MATVDSGRLNGGSNGYDASSHALSTISKRFSDIPDHIDIPVQGGDDDEQAVEVDLEDLLDDPTELCTLLENEGAARQYWMTVSLAYAKQKKVDHAIEMLLKGGQAMRGGAKEKLSMLTCLTWMYLWKSREAPRVAMTSDGVSESKTKEYYLQLSTATLNEALRINPQFPPLFLARGVLQLLRASLQAPSNASGPGAVDHEKIELLRAAQKSFDDALRVSGSRNMLALMGKSRSQYSLGRYADALEGYQEVLHRMPDLIDPDPRIGIGCCFWQLGHKEDAKVAWERALEVNNESKIANILLGLFYLDASSHYTTSSSEFVQLYKKGMTEYTQRSFKADKNSPLTCATFANYFLSKKSLQNVDSLAHRAIRFTDVNAIASDGWYLLARKEHSEDQLDRAADYYRRADEARGGAERGFLPAKFGAAQLSVLKGDFGEAKLRLEKIIQQSKNLEAMMLLGTLYAEEVFTSQQTKDKEDKINEYKKAVGLLETVRLAWKDPKKNLTPDASVLLNLARLYEAESPEKSLQCLQHVEQLELNQVPESELPKGDNAEEQEAFNKTFRESLPPQLLNNMGCFLYQSEKFDSAKDTFELALNACIDVRDRQEDADSDALVTTISFNLGRTYEAAGQLEEAQRVYTGLLARHGEYTDAKTRLAYIAMRQSPTDEGPKAMVQLFKDAPSDMEVRALYGWFLGKNLKKRSNVAEDPELRHYKHTLQHFEKHDRYALIGMGNMFLMNARDMPRNTDQEKKSKQKQYSKAVEFFDKVLLLDPKNAYAAQGVAIAMVEDKKDTKTAVNIFVKVRDTVKDASVFVNLGHAFAELRQYARSIEAYDVALSKNNDPTIMACLGRTWLARGKVEKNLAYYKSALDHSQKALELAPEQIHFKFNVAFVQFQLATAIYNMPEAQRTLQDVLAAAKGLEEAITSLDAIAQSPQTPYPKHDIEQRANMGRNTVRKQLERSIMAQKEYEEKNAEKLHAARAAREAELKRREQLKLAAEEAERERREKIAEERARITERDRELAELRMAEERAREAAELTTDSETGDKIKRKKKPKATGGRRKRKNDDGVTDDEDDTGRERRGSTRSDVEKPKKKRRLAKKSGAVPEKSAKFKSSEIVVESDSEGDDGAAIAAREMEDDMSGADARMGDVGSDEEEAPAVATKRKRQRARLDSDDEDEEDAPAPPSRNEGSPDTEHGDTPMSD